MIPATGMELQFPPRMKAFVQTRRRLYPALLSSSILRLPAFPYSAPVSHRNKDAPPRTQMESRGSKTFHLSVANKGNSNLFSVAFDAFHSPALVCFSRVVSSFSYLPPTLLQFSPLSHTDLPQATNDLLVRAFVPCCNASFGLSSKQALFILFKIQRNRDFPGGLVGKTPCSQCKGSRFHPWSGNKTPHASTKNLACCN